MRIEAERLRTALLSSLSHDLRTPLGAIRGELEAMLDGLLPLTKEGLQSLHEETGRLRRMLEGIEDLAQAQASARYKQRPVQPSNGQVLADGAWENRVPLEL